MPEIAYERDGELKFITLNHNELGTWLNTHVNPVDGEISLDFEASGRHPDGNWATDAAKCEPEARVSIAAMGWYEFVKDICPPCYGANVGVPTSQPHERGCTGGDGSYERLELCTVAIPFDQGMIGGKKGRYIKKVTKKTPTLGWNYLPHTEECIEENNRFGFETIDHTTCACAPWNFDIWGWADLRMFWQSERVKRIHYFNAKYDMWIARSGLRDGAHARCMSMCVGWQHTIGCPNEGIDLSDKLGSDVMIREGITDPATPDSLDSVGKKFFGIGKDNGMDEGLKANGVGLGKRYDLVAWPISGKYAGKDAWLTIRAKKREDEQDECGEIDPKDYPIIIREHEKIKCLFGMERRGVEFDVDLCRDQAVKMHAEVDRLVGQLPFRDTNNAAGEYFFGDPSEGGLGLIPIKMTEGGKPSIDAEVVARLTHESGHAGEVAKLWQHIANMKSVCSKWYDAWPHRAGKDGRLRTNFWQCAVESDRKDKRSGGAISGRLSADRVQLQGLPQDWRIPDGVVGIRQLIRAKPGHQVWEFDASNAEVRVTAWLTKCHALAEIINSGVNIHSANTVNIFGEMLALTFPGGWQEGVPFNAFKSDNEVGWTVDAAEAKLDKDGDPEYVMSDHPDWKKVRTSMKRGIFGTIYASGVRTLKSQIDNDLKDDIPEKQIKGFMDALRAAYPEIGYTSKACERKVDVANGGPGFVRLVSGRRRVFGWGERTYKALNACVQGGVAEMMSVLMLAIDERWPGMLINQVHDSVWLEIPNHMVDEVGAWVKAEGKRIFEEAFSTKTLKVAFKFDSKCIAKSDLELAA